MTGPATHTRTVIYDARDFSPLTVTDLPIHVWDFLWEHDTHVYELQVRQPQALPVLPALYADRQLWEYVHRVALRGVRVRLDANRTIMLVVTETPKLALWLQPAQLPGQHRTEEDLALEAWEAGLRDGALLKSR